MRYEVPISEEMIDELFPFWASIFGEVLPDIERSVFLGSEEAYSQGTLYLRREGEQLAGTCFTMHSKSVPALAGFGEVATDPQVRGRGIATELCGEAVEDFRAAGGEAFFLGTVNPAAARVYHRLGWRKLAGAEVMVNILSGESPEAFLVEYFQKGAATIVEATPADRVPIIPLLLCPHDWKVLDANTRMFSTRYATQKSCMGLYVRYERIRLSGEAPGSLPRRLKEKSLDCRRRAEMTQVSIRLMRSHMRAFRKPGKSWCRPRLARSHEHGMGRMLCRRFG